VWTGLNQIIGTMKATLSRISYFCLLLFLFVLIYTILGMELFSHQIIFDSENNPIQPESDSASEGRYPPWNFNSFWEASTVVFIILANDGWSVIYFDVYRCVGGFQATIYFISLILLGQYILLQLFLSILLK
jgi:hypothetical protein